jgi:hypothetical protein
MKLYAIEYWSGERDDEDADYHTNGDGSLWMTPYARRAWQLVEAFNSHPANSDKTANVISLEFAHETVEM